MSTKLELSVDHTVIVFGIYLTSLSSTNCELVIKFGLMSTKDKKSLLSICTVNQNAKKKKKQKKNSEIHRLL